MRMFVRLWLHHQISLRAAALTYAIILAIVPLLAACLAALTLFADVHNLNSRFTAFLLTHLAPGSGQVVASYMRNLLVKVHFKAIGFVGAGFVIFTCVLLLASIESSINRIWSIRRRKALWKRVLIYNLLVILGPVSVSISLATTAVVAKYFPQYVAKANLGAFLMNTLLLTLIYKIFPNKKVEWLAVMISAIGAAGAIELAKWGYALYTAKALFYNQVYGGLAVLPLFLIWIYLNCNFFFGGALLSYMIQHRQSFRLQNPRKRKLMRGRKETEAAPPAQGDAP